MTNNEENLMNKYINGINSTMDNIKIGEIVSGKVISISDENVIVNIGYMYDGILNKKDISKENLKPAEMFKPGDEIDVYIEKINDKEGLLILSKIRADKKIHWNNLKNAFENEENVECKIKEVVKGGVAAYLGEIRGFIPTSQLSVKYVENLNEFVDRKLEVRIIDINEAKNNIVLSRKKVEEVELEEKKNDTLNKIKPGDKVKGKVTKLMKFGAFVDLGGVEGLIHISELSWERVKNPSDVVSIGDEVEVCILDIDRGKSRISLSLKDITPNPWDNIDKKYKIDDIIKGKIVKIINIGAFVQIEPGVEGLVHVSEISDEHIAKPEDVLQVGNNVNVKILSIDSNAKKISLSIKDAENTSKEDYSEYTNNSEEGFSIGEVFNGKLKNLKLN